MTRPGLYLALLILLVPIQPAQARVGADGAILETAEEAPLDEVLLRDGTLLFGRVVSQDAATLVIETGSLGLVTLPMQSVAEIRGGRQGKSFSRDPDYNSIMFCPTPATLPAGSGYFRDFELFILNFGYAVTDELNLSVATLFPISTTWLGGAFGAKYMLLDREEHPLGLALSGGITLLRDEDAFGAIGVIAGVGDRRSSVNLNLNWSWGTEGDANAAFLLAADFTTTRRSKAFVEYGNGTSLWENSDDFRGFLNAGIRFYGDNLSFSMSGFRPLQDNFDGLLAWPMIMFSKHF